MWKLFWCGSAIVVGLVAFAGWTGARANFLYHHPTDKDVRIVIHKETGAAVVEAIAFPENAPPAPRATAPQTTHEFGRMDPSSSATHAFQIINTGDAPLKLKLGPTSCKCTLSGLDKKELQPGEKANVELNWNTGRTRDSYFAQTATVFTNDPLKKAIEFEVKGKVKMLAGTNLDALELDAAAPDERAAADFLVHSQMWADFTVQEVSSALPGFRWTAEPVDPSSLPKLEMLSIKRVRIEFACPDNGSFQEELRVKVAPGDGSEPVELYLPIRGSSLRRMAFYGPSIDESGIIDLGVIPRGQGHSAKLLVKIRDPEQRLPDAKLEVTPSFLKAELVPHGEAKGLYNLIIEVPHDAPDCQYRSSSLGQLRIATGHPRIGNVDLKVSFAVLPRPRL